MARLPYKQWLRRIGEEAVEDAIDFGDVTVRKLPTRLDLQCKKCLHRGRAWVPQGKAWPRFRCSKCGTRL